MMTRWRRLAVAALLSTMSAPSFAGPHDQAIVEILDEALADWSAFLTCSVLEPETHTLLREWWALEQGALEEVLATADLAPELAAEIGARLTLEQLMAPTIGDVDALIAFCADTDWRRQAVRFGYPRAAEQIADRLDASAK